MVKAGALREGDTLAYEVSSAAARVAAGMGGVGTPGEESRRAASKGEERPGVPPLRGHAFSCDLHPPDVGRADHAATGMTPRKADDVVEIGGADLAAAPCGPSLGAAIL